MGGTQLDTIVVGAGVCGLCSAIALRRAGHNVTVLERLSKEKSQEGGGVCILANGSRILKRWGLNLEAGGFVAGARSDIIDGKSMRLIMSVDGHKEAEEFGDSFYCGTRGGLLRLLLGELEKVGQATIQVEYGSNVIEYDSDRPAVKIANGDWHQADLIVACDGMNMASRNIFGVCQDIPTETGLMSIQFISKLESLLKSKIVAERDTVMIAVDEDDDAYSWLGWPCERESSYATYLRAPLVQGYADSEDWGVAYDKSDLREMFQHWDPLFLNLLDATDKVYFRTIYNRKPLKKLYVGGVCVLGDALRPMPPFRAQNLPQAIEDAGALEVFFSGIIGKDEVPQRLKALEDFRMLHVKTIQKLCSTKQNGPNADTEIEKLLAKIREDYPHEDQPYFASPTSVRSWSHFYDVYEEARKATGVIDS